MKIFGISDLHLDSKKEKPMDVFGENWIDHDKKIFDSWKESVSEDDIVLLPGDISWAISLKDAHEDLSHIEELPGTKIITKGNHDYWWSSMTKMNNMGFKTIKFVHNNSFARDGIEIFGTRGWMSRDSDEFMNDDEVIYLRELRRLENSVKSSKLDNPSLTIALLHFPPFDCRGRLDDFGEYVSGRNIDICLYGHLHGKDGHKYAREGKFGNTEFICVAADYLNFKVKTIKEV
ncbi:hypothetical protein SAMN02745751_01422 [Dethiosulfatibacter aminovorans DSM 17477]|uniref:Calcineurin-like phosphoesterase domain-containing protein n=1 Tax=Dethiosulfatibacter aminovorans DSM 17477 TaxID=1121476 RepID=A0A1M6FBP1_9FIRM|nr:metallophosphoesterase [Dethiosulfatibacter aminovorans]SHI95029.1 hypothetical protein SAMN02745751_01422 [Dethiosulfatibacter aminovorans DSM 17477]